jgi:hypothetical protein
LDRHLQNLPLRHASLDADEIVERTFVNQLHGKIESAAICPVPKTRTTFGSLIDAVIAASVSSCAISLASSE